MNQDIKRFSRLRLGGSMLAITAIASAAMTGAALAQDAAGGDIETVVVSGFKASLERALDAKRNAAGSGDSILAGRHREISRHQPVRIDPAHSGRRAQPFHGEGKQIAVRACRLCSPPPASTAWRH